MNQFFELWCNRYNYLEIIVYFLSHKTDLLQFIEEFQKLLQSNLNSEITGYFPIKSQYIEFTLFIKSFSKILNEILFNDFIRYKTSESPC